MILLMDALLKREREGIHGCVLPVVQDFVHQPDGSLIFVHVN